MAQNQQNKRRTFRHLEQQLTKVIALDLVLFVITLICGGVGIGWLKMTLGILTILLSALGCLFLVLIEEHRRKRSRWMLTSFACILLCTLVSLIVNYPAPAIT